MNPTPFPSHVAIQTGRGTSPGGGKVDPAAFHIPGAAPIAAGSHHTQTVSLPRARLDGWRPCSICLGGASADSLPETPTNAELRRWLPPGDAAAETIERTVFERVRSKEGADHPTNTAALCPACHRRLHFGVDRVEALAKLRAYVAAAEAAFEATA